MENLVGYAKSDLIVPQAPFGDLAAANEQVAAWCAEVNGGVHSEICAVPAERLVIERELLAPLPSLRASTGRLVTRKAGRPSCVFSEARVSTLGGPTARSLAPLLSRENISNCGFRAYLGCTPGSSAPLSRPGPASSTLHASGVVNVARYKGSRRIVSAGREPGHGRGQSLPRPDRRERPARADGPAEHAPGVGVDRVQESAVTA